MSEPTISLRAIIKDETAAQLRGMAGNLKQVSESASGATRSFGVLDAEVDKLSASLQDQIIKLRAQKEALADPVYRKSAEEAAHLRREVDKLNEGISSSTKATEKHGITWSEVVSKYYLASQAFGVVKNGLMSLVDAAKQYDSIRSRLNAAEGSEALGGRDFKEAQEMAKKPGLGFEQVASTMATLRGMKVTAGEAKTLILGIGQANASAAGTAETFGRVMYQIQQSVSLGRLMAEDLRPIVQQIPTLGAAINNTFGTTDAEALNKRLKESKKSVQEFWLEVANLGKNLPAASDTIQNNLDNIGDGWIRLKASLIDTDAVKAATKLLSEFLDVSARAIEGSSARAALKARAEANLGKKTGGYASAGVDIDGLQGGADEAAIQAEMIRIRQADAIKLINEEYDKETLDAAAKKAAIRKKRQQEEDAARNDEAQKAAKSERERIAAHNRASEVNIERNTDGSVSMRDDPNSESRKGHDANRSRAEASREKREEKELLETQRARANAQKIRMDWESALIEKKKQAHEEEMKLIRERADIGQKLVADQAYQVMQGEFTKQGALNATKDVAFRAIADTTTKWIEEQILKMVFAKSAEAASTTASVAQAAVVASAWAPASMATSIGTFGASTAAGSASWFTAMTAAQGYSMMPHERGGMMFGAGLKQREEAWTPLVPSRITPIHNSNTVNHNTTNAQRVTIVTGMSESGLHRALAKVGINGTRSSRG